MCRLLVCVNSAYESWWFYYTWESAAVLNAESFPLTMFFCLRQLRWIFIVFSVCFTILFFVIWLLYVSIHFHCICFCPIVAVYIINIPANIHVTTWSPKSEVKPFYLLNCIIGSLFWLIGFYKIPDEALIVLQHCMMTWHQWHVVMKTITRVMIDKRIKSHWVHVFVLSG